MICRGMKILSFLICCITLNVDSCSIHEKFPHNKKPLDLRTGALFSEHEKFAMRSDTLPDQIATLQSEAMEAEVEVEYCQICTMPTEYCEDLNCSRVRSTSIRLNQTLSPESHAANPEMNAASGQPQRNSKVVRSTKATKAAVVTIKLTLRGSKKFVTTVTGLDAHLPPSPPGGGGGLKDAARLMANALAAGASVVKAAPGGGGDHIAIQGDVVQAVAALCASKLGVPPDAIRVAKTEAKSWKMT